MAARAFSTPLLGLAAASAMLIGAGCDPCRDDGALAICGDFGDLAFETPLPNVQWPPVATSESTLLVTSDTELTEISTTGQPSAVETFAPSSDPMFNRHSAPSLGEDGTAFVVLAGAEVHALDEEKGALRWTSPVAGDAAVAPPTVGNGLLHVSLATDQRRGRELVTLNVQTGDVVSTRVGGSAPVVTADGSLVYVEGPQDCGALYDALVVEDQAGHVRYRHAEPSGIRDFAPGRDGDVFLVAGDHTLVHLSATGVQEWTFTPDCAECTVAGAPTVTDDAIYFPVWEGAAPRGGCDEPDPGFGEQQIDAVDPLFALGHDGKLLWQYDGFATLGARVGNPATSGFLGMATTPRVHHHPAGRPVVASDGTLYVPTDGGVVALDKDGKELGYAVYSLSQGETMQQNGGVFTLGSTPSSVRVPPVVMTDDGRLHVWDGWELRAFETGKAPAHIPWTAPFGGNRNAGRVGG